MNSSLLAQFALSTAMLMMSVAVHGLGLFSLNKALRTEANQERISRITPLSFRGAMFTFGIVMALVAIHGVEIWAYALLYLSIGAVSGLENALYYSTISYSTVGYEASHVDEKWKLLGAFESVAGLILLGWSTAFLFRMLGRIDAH